MVVEGLAGFSAFGVSGHPSCRGRYFGSGQDRGLNHDFLGGLALTGSGAGSCSEILEIEAVVSEQMGLTDAPDSALPLGLDVSFQDALNSLEVFEGFLACGHDIEDVVSDGDALGDGGLYFDELVDQIFEVGDEMGGVGEEGAEEVH